MITRSTFYTVRGGDTIQVEQTASHLRMLGVVVDIILSHEKIDYSQYQLFHFFNIIRPADILYHLKRINTQFVVSTILVDYSEYDKFNRTGLSGVLFSALSGNHIEYFKTVARWILGQDRLMSKDYLWKGQRRSIQELLKKAAMILPNSQSEYQRLMKEYPCSTACKIVPNGIEVSLFKADTSYKKDSLLVLCVARIEGIKNQLNLIRAINGTKYNLLLIGSPSPNQFSYYENCKKLAGNNINFIDQVPQDELVVYYKKAKVHVLPSWFETTGLSSLEAASMGCSIVITDRGDAKEYFQTDAFYCDPASPESILAAVEKASSAIAQESLRNKVLENYTWSKAAQATMDAYTKILGKS